MNTTPIYPCNNCNSVYCDYCVGKHLNNIGGVKKDGKNKNKHR